MGNGNKMYREIVDSQSIVTDIFRMVDMKPRCFGEIFKRVHESDFGKAYHRAFSEPGDFYNCCYEKTLAAYRSLRR